MEFYDKVGKMALGSRLRRLSEKLTDQAGDVYGLYNIEMNPKWFPVFYALAEGEDKSIMQIAQEISHSHPSVSTIVKEMVKHGVAQEVSHKTDARKNYIQLTDKGREINSRIQVQYTDVNAAVETALNETQYNIWKAVEEWEFLLEQKSLLNRVKDEKKLRESEDVQIVDYKPEYQHAFKQLNEEWITQYFKMEPTDHKSLNHPDEYILDKGGHIFIALYNNEPIGACALVKMDDNIYELAKMAVSPKAKGKGIGFILGQACITKARELGATKLYLESNAILKPAISLYHKLGFKKVTGIPSPYERCNIQMTLEI
ncbi:MULTISPECIES: bifunctional helix-turn-helix transcriptional regulator/GNAT family N-acetyltransferase [unclassified Mucilaginibacter]|uniref:bifunctional helix-turn-helix transcriptional regulator/GNAT family N-acetyltransferase n=1 Tax=unclassified Mucilaginibacter TaxID=2617802 RepID=UPI002AC89E8B|nr:MULTISPECIES: bifunctional helix-turn-helix transcriptional regulator/GNAT family N-acetyltransferase [unclassified Mucilaginibacter]MEB0260427.1 bifunctional helix-turn-helix transcriptional regulator/GNAT family N-acetyltransferase [Mucilaginibacter sp. 10I4]MEB0280008.1 bifunctional helix-turn-helix transcriptional regulator/GNAT family N-acetyltransferase [Mucilaginibacter sp. 10B2]MEB0301354.1 bifunctional helix-turn-helix transcriptional regulator/GNAT family N-acetyltransferase [Mucila